MVRGCGEGGGGGGSSGGVGSQRFCQEMVDLLLEICQLSSLDSESVL